MLWGNADIDSVGIGEILDEIIEASSNCSFLFNPEGIENRNGTVGRNGQVEDLKEAQKEF